ncbi:outer membrane beta-barrel protein [Mucilaginibacter sp. S1162]|uniref:Outer membrane beta-barrel protein n=1 Tax=Mucilaginibacter humi TaxID=2732510 RepID=A0ABX1W7E0_9SPHI|nr:outer membrane beta-barrel protein [Mucilaginibacter humi]
MAGQGQLSAGLKTSYVHTDNAANYFNLINNVSTIDYNATNRFYTAKTLMPLMQVMTRDFNRFAIQAGLRIEHTDISGHQLGNAPPVIHHLPSIIPAFSLQFIYYIN